MLFIEENETDANNTSNVSFNLQQWWESIIVCESELFLHVTDNP